MMRTIATVGDLSRGSRYRLIRMDTANGTSRLQIVRDSLLQRTMTVRSRQLCSELMFDYEVLSTWEALRASNVA